MKKRKESSAEHTWSCLILADYFLDKTSQKLDKLKIYELLMYHDVVEIEAGDTGLHPKNDGSGKQDRELKAMKELQKQIPSSMKNKYALLFEEFEKGETPEAKFAIAIDKLDAIIQELDYKEDWKGWSEEFVRKNKEKYFEPFPEIKQYFESLMAFLVKEGYFNQ